MHHQPPPTVVTTRRGANHSFHVIMSILTCGMWAIFVWPIAAIMGRKTKVVTQPQAYYPPPPPGQGPYPPQQPPHQ
ncbi:hypothetical protein [Streptomyces sp. NPDC088812]|uniref:hypothetical protein n=1 Tax=Streptomyces sp. NPDC088812 TaxID=3365905 RepID=UPI0037F4B7D4